jgi:hypothetical protein
MSAPGELEGMHSAAAFLEPSRQRSTRYSACRTVAERQLIECTTRQRSCCDNREKIQVIQRPRDIGGDRSGERRENPRAQCEYRVVGQGGGALSGRIALAMKGQRRVHPFR